ncbi:MAG TPA: GDSL family lipase [Bacteroidetes bacterium]|nr:GDSL family lipase [Bacteroidota bacterium]
MSNKVKSTWLVISLVFNLLFIAALLFALNKYGGWKNLWWKINNRGIEKTYLHRKNLFEMLPGKDSAIVFLGNSLTAYGEWAELMADARVVNRGIPGDHCDGVRQRLGDIARLHPQKVFLMIGINDLAFHPPETVLVKYEKLLAALARHLPDTAIYLQSVFPVNNRVSPTPINNSDVRQLNEGIRRLAAQYQMNFLDTHPILADADGNLHAKFTLDGIHLNGRAYRKWKDFLLQNVESGK